MKKLIAILLLLSIALSFVSCKSKKDEITCYDIAEAYEDAGYYVKHGEHNDEDEYCYCNLIIRESEDSDSDAIYFTTYFTVEDAKAAKKLDKYNLVIWLFSTILGESRWLKAKTYGKIEYTYYKAKMVKPFNKLIK